MGKPLKPSAAFSEAERVRVTAACERFIDEFLRPRFLPSIRPTEFNYPVDILGKWHGPSIASSSATAPASRKISVRSSTRPSLDSTGISPDRFDIQWHRHTGEWFRLHRGLTLVKAIETLGSDGILRPL